MLENSISAQIIPFIILFMNITVNGEVISVGENDTLNKLICDRLHLKTKGIAVAVNNAVIPSDNWVSIQLSDNDNIVIIQATQGG